MIKKKIKNMNGFSLIELIIVIGLMSVVTVPAYLALVNGHEIFHHESTYQTILSDVQVFYGVLNDDVRINGFRNIEVLNDSTQLSIYPELVSSYNEVDVLVLKVDDSFYYLENGSVKALYSGIEKNMVDNIIGFSVSKIDSQTFQIDTTILYENRQETISTKIYTRY